MYVDLSNITLPKPILYLCKPNREVIGVLTEAYGIKHNIKLGQISELTFTLPYNIEIDHKLVDNPHIKSIKHKYQIKYVLDTYEEWYTIDIPTSKSDDDTNTITISCFSLGYELSEKLIRIYSELSKTATEFLVDILSGTIWSVGYVNAEFDLMHRSFDVTNRTVLDMVFEGATTFGGIIVWNTENREVNLYQYEQIGMNQGLVLDYGKYIKDIEHTLDTENFCTRLYVTGKDGASINRANPSGQAYIEDYSYFMRGFSRTPVNPLSIPESKVLDNNYNVLEMPEEPEPIEYTVTGHSDYMSDSLCNAILDYQDKITHYETYFSYLLNQLTTLQEQYLDLLAEKYTLDEELLEAQDNLDIAQSTGQSVDELLDIRDDALSAVNAKQIQINNKQTEINAVYDSISDLHLIIGFEYNFTPEQITELNQYVIEKEVSNEFISNEAELLAWGKKAMAKINEPQINIEVSIVNLLLCLDPECVADRNKISLNGGDIITIKYKKFDIDIEANIVEIDLDFEKEDMKLTISNIKDISKDFDKFLDIINKSMSTNTTVDMNKYKWNKIEETSNDVATILNGVWDAVAREINAGVNESVIIGQQGILLIDPTDPLRLIRMTHGVLGISIDGGRTYHTALTGAGVFAERLVGQIIAGERLVITTENNSLTVDETGVTIDGTQLTITGGIDPSQINGGGDWVEQNVSYGGVVINSQGLVATSIPNSLGVFNTISLNSNDGILIRKWTDEYNYTDKFYVNTDGDLVFSGNMTGGTIKIGSGVSVFHADTYGIYLGSDTFAYAPFRVSASGNLHAINADIQGEIDCSELKIYGESIFDIASTMISDAIFQDKLNSLDLYAKRIHDAQFPLHYLEMTSPNANNFLLTATNSAGEAWTLGLINDEFHMKFNGGNFIVNKQDPTDPTNPTKRWVDCYGTWNFENSIVVSDSHFEIGQAEWNSAGIDFDFDNVYNERPIYLVHPPCNTNTRQNDAGEFIGITVVPIGGQTGDLYNIIAFCKGYLRKNEEAINE